MYEIRIAKHLVKIKSICRMCYCVEYTSIVRLYCVNGQEYFLSAIICGMVQNRYKRAVKRALQSLYSDKSFCRMMTKGKAATRRVIHFNKNTQKNSIVL